MIGRARTGRRQLSSGHAPNQITKSGKESDRLRLGEMRISMHSDCKERIPHPRRNGELCSQFARLHDTLGSSSRALLGGPPSWQSGSPALLHANAAAITRPINGSRSLVAQSGRARRTLTNADRACGIPTTRNILKYRSAAGRLASRSTRPRGDGADDNFPARDAIASHNQHIDQLTMESASRRRPLGIAYGIPCVPWFAPITSVGNDRPNLEEGP